MAPIRRTAGEARGACADAALRKRSRRGRAQPGRHRASRASRTAWTRLSSRGTPPCPISKRAHRRRSSNSARECGRFARPCSWRVAPRSPSTRRSSESCACSARRAGLRASSPAARISSSAACGTDGCSCARGIRAPGALTASSGTGGPPLRSAGGGASMHANATFARLGFYMGTVSGFASVGAGRGAWDGHRAPFPLREQLQRRVLVRRTEDEAGSRNRFVHNRVYGFDPHTGSSGFLVRGNYAARNGRHGIIFSHTCHRNVIRGNVSEHNSWHGIVIDDGKARRQPIELQRRHGQRRARQRRRRHPDRRLLAQPRARQPDQSEASRACASSGPRRTT